METIDQWQANGDFFESHGHQLFYRSQLNHGSNKPVLVLIHGFPTCSWDWSKIWESLATRFQLVTLDMLGFGFSDKPVQAYSIMQQADLFQTLLDKLNIQQYHILAHDYGDTVAQELLARDAITHDIQSVVFSNGGLFPETHKPVFIQKLLLSPIGFLISKLTTYAKFSATFDHICAKALPEQELKTYWNMLNHKQGVKVMHKLISYMLERRKYRSRWVSGMQHSQTPIHLIDGTLDPISGEHMVKRYQELIPNPSIDRLTDTGHYPQVESPGEFVNCAHEFWESIKA
jgi:pimeloyl-ACP methyl ester carboxylesterase